MNIYLDVCCLNRPFDDQTQDIIHLETEAILAILFHCEQGEWHLIGSEIIELEINKTSDEVKRQKIFLLYQIACDKTRYTEQIKLRAMELQKYGITLFDALHLASAESKQVDVFLTTDIKLVKLASKSDVRIQVKNPVTWLMEEVVQNGYND